MSDTPSFNDTSKSVTFSDTDNINDFVLSENLIDSDLFFKESISEVDFVSDFSSVDLDFENVVFLLSQIGHQVVLSVGNNSDN